MITLLGGGGFAWNVLWYILIAALILWALGFLLRGADGGGRWCRWWSDDLIDRSLSDLCRLA